MRLREKGKKDGEVIMMGWDEAQAALRAGTHVSAEGSETGERDDTKQTDGGAPTDDGLDAKTRPELEALAKERGVDVSGARTKDDVLKALRAPR